MDFNQYSEKERKIPATMYGFGSVLFVKSIFELNQSAAWKPINFQLIKRS